MPGVNPYRVAPKIVDPGLGAGANPAGAGSGGGNPEFEDQYRVGQLAPADRKAYIESTVPKQNILEFLKANVASLSSDKLKPVPGFIGARKESGTIYFFRNTRELHFVNEMTGNWRTTVVQSESQLRNLAKNDFHLFPNAGE